MAGRGVDGTDARKLLSWIDADRLSRINADKVMDRIDARAERRKLSKAEGDKDATAEAPIAKAKSKAKAKAKAKPATRPHSPTPVRSGLRV